MAICPAIHAYLPLRVFELPHLLPQHLFLGTDSIVKPCSKTDACRANRTYLISTIRCRAIPQVLRNKSSLEREILNLRTEAIQNR